MNFSSIVSDLFSGRLLSVCTADQYINNDKPHTEKTSFEELPSSHDKTQTLKHSSIPSQQSTVQSCETQKKEWFTFKRKYYSESVHKGDLEYIQWCERAHIGSTDAYKADNIFNTQLESIYSHLYDCVHILVETRVEPGFIETFIYDYEKMCEKDMSGFDYSADYKKYLQMSVVTSLEDVIGDSSYIFKSADKKAHIEIENSREILMQQSRCSWDRR